MANHGTLAELDALIAAAGLQAKSSAIKKLALPSVRMSRKPQRQPRALGTSRAGGDPDLPIGMAFPELNGRTLTFLLQIRLADLSPFPCARVLPRDGLLSFFIDDAESDDEYLGLSRVIYTWPNTPLRRLEFPIDRETEANRAMALAFEPVMTLPPYTWKLVKQLKLRGADSAAYNDAIYNEFGYGTDAFAKIVGWKRGYQQLLGHHRNSYHDVVAAGEVGLLVLSSDDELEWTFGDGNRLGFYIDADALAARHFDEAYSFHIDAC